MILSLCMDLGIRNHARAERQNIQSVVEGISRMMNFPSLFNDFFNGLLINNVLIWLLYFIM